MGETNTVHSPLVTYASMLSLLCLCPPFVILLWVLCQSVLFHFLFLSLRNEFYVCLCENTFSWGIMIIGNDGLSLFLWFGGEVGSLNPNLILFLVFSFVSIENINFLGKLFLKNAKQDELELELVQGHVQFFSSFFQALNTCSF